MAKLVLLIMFISILSGSLGLFVLFDFNNNDILNTDSNIINKSISITVLDINITNEYVPKCSNSLNNLNNYETHSIKCSGVVKIYEVSISVQIYSNSTFNVTYGCSNPFQVKIVNTNLVTYDFPDFTCFRAHTITEGISIWYLGGQFTVEKGFNLPGLIAFKVILGNNIANSSNSVLFLK